MKTSDAVVYVQANARYMGDAPNTPYYVRFPTPWATTIFFSNDTHDLVTQLLRYTRTSKGRRDHDSGKWKKYLNAPDIDMDDCETPA